jgi:hypothetical protein
MIFSKMDYQVRIRTHEPSRYKVQLVVPAGRKRYMDVLVPQILKQSGWDEFRIWVNTRNEDDLRYLDGLPRIDNRISLALPKEHQPDGNKTIGQFFKDCIAPDTLYIRLDDDICYLEPGAIGRLAQYRATNKEPFLVSPIVINNALFSYLFQVLGKIQVNARLTANCLDPLAWKNSGFAESIHNLFLSALADNQIDRFKFSSRPIAMNRFSINCISWLGSEFERFGGNVPYGEDEEEFLSVTKPTQLGKVNHFFGECLVAHFAYYTQREHLDKTDILERYKALALRDF